MKNQSWSLEEPCKGDMIAAGETPMCSTKGSQGLRRHKDGVSHWICAVTVKTSGRW